MRPEEKGLGHLTKSMEERKFILNNIDKNLWVEERKEQEK